MIKSKNVREAIRRSRAKIKDLSENSGTPLPPVRHAILAKDIKRDKNDPLDFLYDVPSFDPTPGLVQMASSEYVPDIGNVDEIHARINEEFAN